MQNSWNETKQRGDHWFWLFWAVAKVYGKHYLITAIPQVLSLIVFLLQPIIASRMILYISSDDSVWNGLGLVTAFFICKSIQFTCQQWVWYSLELIGMRARSALTLMVYRKSLQLIKVSRGNANNVMNVDPGKIANLTWFANRFWNLPLEITLALLLLYNWLGWQAMTALGIMLLLMPINYWMLKRFNETQTIIMKLEDKRIKLITEIINGISVVKLFGWEDAIAAKVNTIRAKEIVQLKWFAYLLALLMFFVLSLTTFISVGTFSVYALTGGDLSAHKIFPSLVLFNSLSWPVISLPGMISRISEARTSLVRLSKFLRRDNLTPVNRTLPKNPENSIEISNASFEWEIVEDDEEDDETGCTHSHGSSEHDKDDELKWPDEKEQKKKKLRLSMSADGHEETDFDDHDFILSDIDMKIRKGSLVAVIGPVGAGKSSLLSAMIGEMSKIAGTTKLYGKVAYVAQQAWIRNTTLRDNILFTRPFNKKHYKSTIAACALIDDLKVLAAGDATEIGEKGVNLSGGQKQRVALARALYASADIYLLDDPLSAVDAHVGQHLFTKCISQAMANTTRVLVTHQLQYLDAVDYIYVMDHGKITQHGTYTQLEQSGVDFATLLLKSDKQPDDIKEDQLHDKDEEEDDDVIAKQKLMLNQSDEKRMLAISQELHKSEVDIEEFGKRGRLTDEEERVTGAVKAGVYKQYMLQTGGLLFLGMLFTVSVLMQGSEQFKDYWLAVWSNAETPNLRYYLGIYVGVSLFGTLNAVIRQFSWAKGTLDCAKRMHENLLMAILKAPMSFFQATPTGRIVNRFSKDQNAVDSSIPDLLSDWFLCMFASIATLLMIIMVMPLFLITCIPLGAVYFVVMRRYNKTARELGRLESISASPVFAQYSETLEGVSTVRAFQAQDSLESESERFVTNNVKTYYCRFVSGRWLGWRLEAIGCLTAVTLYVFVVLTKGWLSAGLVGLALTLSTAITGNLNWFVRSGSMLETNMNRVERILHYTATEPEGDFVIDGHRVEKTWPERGEVNIHNLSLKYRDDLEYALKDITVRFEAGEKIGIVGRTGAGKSSLITALFRLFEPCGGSIMIDGVDIADIGLHDLRKNLTIIPQDPILFSGTVRNNLDPFEEYGDRLLWNTLARVSLKAYFRSCQGLDTPVEAGGTNLSVGQRQLLCMARALLKKNKVIVMDEATANVDNETDRIIQETVRTEFREYTVLTIAHRLNTIMDSDKVLVMSKGSVVEFGEPLLLLNKRGTFFSLVQDTGDSQAAFLKDLATKAHKAKQQEKLTALNNSNSSSDEDSDASTVTSPTSKLIEF